MYGAEIVIRDSNPRIVIRLRGDIEMSRTRQKAKGNRRPSEGKKPIQETGQHDIKTGGSIRYFDLSHDKDATRLQRYIASLD